MSSKSTAKKPEKKPAKKEAEKHAAEKKEHALKKQLKKDIWTPEEKVEKKLAPKLEKPSEEKTEHAHLASAAEVAKTGIDASIVFYPLVTEKAVNMIEAQNKLCFIVSEKANKTSVKKAIEAMYGAKVDAVNIVRDMKGRKKAIVKINKKFKADEIAMKLGVI